MVACARPYPAFFRHNQGNRLIHHGLGEAGTRSGLYQGAAFIAKLFGIGFHFADDEFAFHIFIAQDVLQLLALFL